MTYIFRGLLHRLDPQSGLYPVPTSWASGQYRHGSDSASNAFKKFHTFQKCNLVPTSWASGQQFVEVTKVSIRPESLPTKPEKTWVCYSQSQYSFINASNDQLPRWASWLS